MENIVREFLKEKNVEYLFEDFMDLLVCNEQLRFKIFRDYERDAHREDVRAELDEMEIEYTDAIAEEITNIYEDRLLDLDDWHFVLRECILDFVGEGV